MIVETDCARAVRYGPELLGTPDFRKSFLTTRLVVGLFGVTLPVHAIVGEPLMSGNWSVRDALSDYYYSGLRNWFVGSLFAIGAGLLVYMATKRSRPDGVLSFVAGVCAILVALFPTNEVGAEPSAVAVGSFRFRSGPVDPAGHYLLAIRDPRRHAAQSVRPAADQLAEISSVLCRGHLVVGSLVRADGRAERGALNIPMPYAVLFGESLAVLAFGFSWLLKGSELLTMALNERGIPVWQPKSAKHHGRAWTARRGRWSGGSAVRPEPSTRAPALGAADRNFVRPGSRRESSTTAPSSTSAEG